MGDLNSFGFGQTSSITSVQSRNRVLRNTYALLALSMVPTVIGSWLGVATGFNPFASSPFMGFIVFMAVAFGFFWAIEKNKDTGIGVLLLLGFTFFMGLMLSRLLGFTLNSYSNGAALIMLSFGGTASIFAVMATIATVSKSDFSGLGEMVNGRRTAFDCRFTGKYMATTSRLDAHLDGWSYCHLLGIYFG